MKTPVGVTGPRGFIASYLVRRLSQRDDVDVLTADRQVTIDDGRLDEFVSSSEVLYHIAGVNRGSDRDVAVGNTSLAESLISAIRRTSARPHVVFASSSQRDRTNVYGTVKRACEQLLSTAAQQLGFPLTTVVIPNVFGPGCKPFYNSVVATFCHQLAEGKTPQVDVDSQVGFLHVNDVVDSMIRQLDRPAEGITTRFLDPAARITVSELLRILRGFQEAFFGDGVVPDLADPLLAGLYGTFLSYVGLDDHRHRPQIHSDDRGSLYEIIKLANGGQVFFSSTKPGVIRGDHFHTRKFEWFCVVRGEAVIRLRHIQSQEIREFRVSGTKPEYISIPALYTHHIENTGTEDLLTMFWCNEIFSADDPDTYYEKVA